ncbi:MAG: acetyl/propionyl/methylcrotonyl-CoA carboxylase subunit alpha [Sulfuricurvum sp.]|uniref:acetyl-CoA carboxylase biotin carboxylase subunit n=1 Tax=Sulfuricurvum sp. TaxID=2025608 RepID=UPI00262055C6|nr:acetyl-CoA carboxylase biotin carboxylase subunit [Sulfuricurvum sp.]MDD2838726.1 acetyl-CoA carboxylase biotin carboxylase subunit [Sulfuricurvum sp.]MDD3595573.1 acetyl-CoA carboxylase biotin carboxylase subunit [Sulfuricurvum sp.]MDD4884951.1 acetyl-CoA carboxylase biotin carboxylase subunit [Sulfuricurvum sp.]
MNTTKISKILIANRGEIALRIIRACKELGIKSVVVFSEVDVNGVWVRKADECYPILGDPIAAYLDYERIISLAKKADCDAIHPGYGFLSESAEFAQACIDNGLIFIGPKPEHVALFGDKMASKVAMRAVGVPMLPGTDEPIDNINDAEKIAADIGFPVIIKAAFGGGGRGMRIVEKASDFKEMYESATKEALRFFSRGEVFIEKYLKNPRHIEIQIVADKYGNVVHLGDRDCSIQRRHQKVIEIAPSPLLNEATRRELYRISTKAMFKLGYESVGTIEYLVDQDDNIYFIEMNTRVQVEHPVTEMISGIDLIQRMIQIAEGDPLKFMQEEIKFRGYAIEFRINAENPKQGFVPSPGLITNYLAPGGPGVRLDSSAYTNYKIPANYDSMVGKLIVSALTWEDAVRKATRALDEFLIEGVPTNIPLHRQIVRDQDFIDGKLDTGYLDTKLQHFNLDAIHNMDDEEAKMKQIEGIINAIKANNLNVRH